MLRDMSKEFATELHQGNDESKRLCQEGRRMHLVSLNGQKIMNKPLPTSKMKEGVIWLPTDAPSPKPITINSPAIDVMTDLRRVHVMPVATRESFSRATQIMIARRVRLLLVVNTDGLIEGLLSARDTMGEKPIKLLQERRDDKYEDLIVSDLTVPRHAIDVLDIKAVLRANVGSI